MDIMQRRPAAANGIGDIEPLIRRDRGIEGTPELRVCHGDGYDMPYLSFQKLEQTGIVKHLFTTRHGGVSEHEFSSMNLSFSRGDDREKVLENFRRVAAAMDGSLKDFVSSDQTHTVNVRAITEKDRGKGVLRERDYHDVDGLVTNVPGIILGTFYADCVPLFFVDPVHKAIGLGHSGWRGTVSFMGRAVLQRMQENYGTRPEEVYAAIGPSICRDCYEVSEDVAQAFEQAFRQTADASKEEAEAHRAILYAKGHQKYQLDLWRANEIVLLDAGITREHIAVTDLCTCCNPELLFSHRVSHGKRGNLGAFMKLV